MSSALVDCNGEAWLCVMVVAIGDGTFWRPAPNPTDGLPKPRPPDAVYASKLAKVCGIRDAWPRH